jgi:hypothetical protein
MFARYWDDALTPAEWDALNARLDADPVARQWFREVSAHAVAAGEVPTSSAAPPAPMREVQSADPPPTTESRRSRRLSRRAALGFGLGTAAGLTAGGLIARSWVTEPSPAPGERTWARLTWTRGEVVATADGPGNTLAVGAVITPGSGVSTVGPTSSAVVELVDGSTLCLSADTTVAVRAGGRVVLEQGGATADLRAPVNGRPSAEVVTPLVELIAGGEADVDLTSGGRATELTVQRGQVGVCDHAEGIVTSVRDGELLTVAANGGRTVRPAPVVPDKYTLDIRDRLPEGWRVGTRELTPDGPVVVTERWYDPIHRDYLYQIRSHNQWTRGLVRLFPDSVVSVKYHADRPADGQVILVVRRPRTSFKDSGCVSWDGRFDGCQAGEWRTLSVRAADMLGGDSPPPFAPPWVAFMLIFNTYTEDVGLRVADFRVSRPGGSA